MGSRVYTSLVSQNARPPHSGEVDLTIDVMGQFRSGLSQLGARFEKIGRNGYSTLVRTVGVSDRQTR